MYIELLEVTGMKRFENILIKLVIIQFIFLLSSQIIFHHFNAFPELKVITQYEGVNENNFTKIIETFQNR
jgi:Family of unknown function (DUF5359)